MVGFWIFMILGIICGTILFGIYMFYCAENKIKMFENKSIYEKRLLHIEKQMQKLLEGN